MSEAFEEYRTSKVKLERTDQLLRKAVVIAFILSVIIIIGGAIAIIVGVDRLGVDVRTIENRQAAYHAQNAAARQSQQHADAIILCQDRVFNQILAELPHLFTPGVHANPVKAGQAC